MAKLDEIILKLSPDLKLKNYKKNRRTWAKVKDNLTVIFSIQKSQYDSDTWYYQFGICLHAICDGNTQSIGRCQITYRINHMVDGVFVSAESISQLIDRWESMYGDLHLLTICAVQGKLPGQYSLDAVRYLTTVDLSRLL